MVHSQGKIDKSAIIAEDFCTHFSESDGSIRQKMNTVIED
jgi:hypothetical protein